MSGWLMCYVVFYDLERFFDGPLTYLSSEPFSFGVGDAKKRLDVVVVGVP